MFNYSCNEISKCEFEQMVIFLIAPHLSLFQLLEIYLLLHDALGVIKRKIMFEAFEVINYSEGFTCFSV